jgi:hypothetical protein
MGKVGIGTNSPSVLLDVAGDATVRGALTVAGGITGFGAGLSGLDATNLSSGTVPLARLSGITSNQMDATERDKLGGAQDAAQVTAIVGDILSTNVAADSAKLGGKDASSYVVDDGTGAWNNNENGGGHSSTNWYEVVAMYGIFGGLYLDGGEIHMGDGGIGGGDIWLHNGKLYMSNNMSAYFYGGEVGGMHAVKIGSGYLDMGGSLGVMMGSGAGSGGQAISMEGGYLAMNNAGGSGGGDLYLDSGKLYMSNSSSAYLCGSEVGGMHAVKIGSGYLDMGGSLGVMMGSGAGSGGQAISMEGGYLAMNNAGGSGGGDLYLDSGKLYMSNNASAYLYGGEANGSPAVKVGAGNFDLAGKYMFMNGVSGSGGMGLYMDGGHIGMNNVFGAGGGNIYLDSGKLYMSNSASAYFYGSDTGGVHTIKVGNGGLDLEGSSGIVYHPPLGNLSMGVYTNR